MRRIRAKGTAPELLIRRTVYRMGYRYRLHDASLLGRPDLVFKGRKKVIFVHGCFWHGHSGCPDGRTPTTNREYWLPKLNRNRERDERIMKHLATIGWEALIVWECETGDIEAVRRRLRNFLGPPRSG